MAARKTVAARQSGLVSDPEAIREGFKELVMMVPEIDGDGGARIIAQILAGGSSMDSNEIWTSGESDKLIGVELIIRGIDRFESDHKEGIGWYFLIEAINTKTSELIRFSNGSQTVMAQLTKAHMTDEFPIRATIVEGRTRPGHTGKPPQHLTIHGVRVE